MISIVDDDVFVGESIRTLVESLGYEVATFESAERFWNPNASRKPRA
jgi:FixJ family two-component response regulator